MAFHPGFVRSNFAEDTTFFMRWFYHSPLRFVGTISPETSARRLVSLIEGTSGRDWKPGEVYSKSKPMKVAFRDANGAVAKELWERFLWGDLYRPSAPSCLRSCARAQDDS